MLGIPRKQSFNGKLQILPLKSLPAHPMASHLPSNQAAPPFPSPRPTTQDPQTPNTAPSGHILNLVSLLSPRPNLGWRWG